MDENQVHSELVTGNIEIRKWWHRRWVKIFGICLVFLAIFTITLGLVLKIVILGPKQAETSVASTTATESLATLPTTSQEIIEISTTTTTTTELPPLTTETARITSSAQQQINDNSKWEQDGITVAGGNGPENQIHLLVYPQGLYIDDDNQRMFIADLGNRRIAEWKYGATSGEVVAGGNGHGNQINQLHEPRSVTFDKKNQSLIVCDYCNKRVVRWFYRTNINPQIIISNINCYDVKLDRNGGIYVSDWAENEVTRWTENGVHEAYVAGGNEPGNGFEQLNNPTNIFVNEDYSVYVTDQNNHRVMKWSRGAREGIVIAGGNGQGHDLNQLHGPSGVAADRFGNVYVADCSNHRVMRWLLGAKEGTIVVGGNGAGNKANQFNCPIGLSFDRESNLYVSDFHNHRVQKFDRIVE
ncbi:unnamed protein product [Adineta steineri]|uniref:NHL repeat containing protein-like protein n=1 Tax=Adineta steineri TaxID=433720 RepID=A0A813Q7R3_9BILA|nr:unnamed protein product [Adineta steineri]CAF4082773.1 unnamed protein product [Adineta steineri]